MTRAAPIEIPAIAPLPSPAEPADDSEDVEPDPDPEPEPSPFNTFPPPTTAVPVDVSVLASPPDEPVSSPFDPETPTEDSVPRLAPDVVDVRVPVEVGSGLSDACHAMWIMGAYTLSVGMLFSDTVVGTAATARAPDVPLVHPTVSMTVEVAIEMQVCPFWFAHRKPRGQHPTAVSPGAIWNCIDHPVAPPAVAEQADV